MEHYTEGGLVEVNPIAANPYLGDRDAESNFEIRVADTDEGRGSASLLINKMYAWRGYGGTHRLEDNPNLITLSASEKGEVIGTISLSIDSPIGILADQVFRDQIDLFRQRGAKVCEFTKLAFDAGVRSKQALAALFHTIVIYARLHQCTDVFIEVNPRHQRYYEVMLGFTRQCEIRENSRVNAPACLMWSSLDAIESEAARLGGNSNHLGKVRSLYPYFFAPEEADGIAKRLMRLE